MRTRFALFTFFPLWALGAALLCACGGEEKKANPTEDTGMQLAENVSIFSSKDNQKEWLLQADSVDFSGMEKATLKKPLLLLNENGKKSAQVSGEVGIFDYPQKRVTIEGNAKAVSFTEGADLASARFFYQIDEDRIWSDTRTTGTAGGVKITAKGGIETDSKLAKIQIKKQTTRLPKTTKNLKRVTTQKKKS